MNIHKKNHIASSFLLKFPGRFIYCRYFRATAEFLKTAYTELLVWSCFLVDEKELNPSTFIISSSSG
jgi:hypothetical protein